MPKRRTHAEVAPCGTMQTFKAAKEGTRINRETTVKSKIISHFIKRKISFSPMEIILMIPGVTHSQVPS
jgi:hypothetical protein